MVRMGIAPVRHEDDARPETAIYLRQFDPGRDRRFQFAVHEAGVLAVGDAENFRRGLGFSPTFAGVPVGRRLAARQVHDADAPAGTDQADDHPAHPEFRVVRMRRDDQIVQMRLACHITPPVHRRPGVREAKEGSLAFSPLPHPSQGHPPLCGHDGPRPAGVCPAVGSRTGHSLAARGRGVRTAPLRAAQANGFISVRRTLRCTASGGHAGDIILRIPGTMLPVRGKPISFPLHDG